MQYIKKRWYLLLIPMLVGGTAALLHSRVKHVEDSPVMHVAPWALTMAAVREGSIHQGFPALGKVVSSSEVRIVPQISGTILKMGPREGGMVHKGDMLLHLDTRALEADAGSLKAKLISAEAVEKNDQKELQREQNLMQEGGSSASVVEQRQTRVHSDQANVSALKKQLESLQVKISYGHILAPISGRIAKRFAELGDAVFPGKVVYTLTAEEGGRVVVPVPLSIMTHIQTGGQVVLSQGTQKMLARITRINPSLDALAMGSLEIDLPERPFHLPSGAPISVRVFTAAATGLIVPVNSLRPAQQSTQRILFKVVDEPKPHVQRLTVRVAMCGNEACVVAGDVQVGDHVIVAHGSVLLQLHDGDPVSVREQTKVQP